MKRLVHFFLLISFFAFSPLSAYAFVGINAWSLPFLEHIRSDQYSFAVVGETRGGISALQEIALRDDVDFVVHLGNFTSRGEENEFLEFAKIAKMLLKPVFIIPGNREGKEISRKFFLETIGEGDFSFRFGNRLFLFLDNGNGTLSRSGRDMLLKNLSVRTTNGEQPLTFVFMHQPIFDPRRQGMKSGYSMDVRYASELLDFLCEKYLVSMIFASHTLDEYTNSGMWKTARYAVVGGSNTWLQVFVTGNDVSIIERKTNSSRSETTKLNQELQKTSFSMESNMFLISEPK